MRICIHYLQSLLVQGTREQDVLASLKNAKRLIFFFLVNPRRNFDRNDSRIHFRRFRSLYTLLHLSQKDCCRWHRSISSIYLIYLDPLDDSEFFQKKKKKRLRNGGIRRCLMLLRKRAPAPKAFLRKDADVNYSEEVS